MSSSTAWTRPKLSESRRTTSSPCTIMRTAGLPTDPTRGTDCCPTRPSAGCAQRGGNRHHKDCRQPGRHRLPHAGPPPADKSRRIAPHRTAEASACEACVHGTTASLQPAAQLARAPTRLDAQPGLAAGPRLGTTAGRLGSVADRTSQSSPVPARIPRGRQLVASLLPVTHSTGSSPSGRLLPGGPAHRWPGRCRSDRRLHCPIESDSMGHLEVLPLDTRDRDRTYVDVVGWLSRALTCINPSRTGHP